jgi:6-pyruvoyltetrahydropterin/6-carboxytetrahydropterin synthase
MQTITKVIEWDMGHRIPFHNSKCRNLHGHRYRLEVTVSGELCNKKDDSSEGMVFDFGDLKEVMMLKIHDVLDHSFMWYKEDKIYITIESILKYHNQKVVIVDFIPTAENICNWIYHEMIRYEIFINKGLILENIKLFETPNSWAELHRDE